MLWCIPHSNHPSVLFACEELKRHWDMLGDLWPCADLTLQVGGGSDALPPVESAELDDAVLIAVDRDQGVITGSNPRSVLIAAYRFLHELGFWFVKPGRHGTLLRYNGRTTVNVCERAAYRHRGFCIEGAVSFENILQFVDWMPKNGYNTYFTQFLVPYEFFKTWYAHDNNPLLAGIEPVPSVQEVERFTYGTLNDELKKRGIVFQAAGHGWTTNAIGIPGLGWDKAPEPDARYTHWLAQIDGKRALFHSRPLNTQLCYSQPEVRERLTDEVLDFLHKYPQVDVIHFWLADESNNSCQCDACREEVPSAFYIQMLNLLDEKLSREGLSTKIVLLAYLDLLWPPQSERLRHPDRFLFMFAPITRSYSRPLPTDTSEAALPPFERGRLQMPQSVRQNIAFLKAWQRVAPCDSFIYEYHYMWDLFKDVSDLENARILWQDVKNLKELGLNGYISCQQTRAFFPAGFGMYVLGQTLWNRELAFEDLTDEYFHALFDQNAPYVLSLLNNAAHSMHPTCIRGEESIVNERYAADYQRLRMDCLTAGRRCMQEALSLEGTASRLWMSLSYWCRLCAGYAYYLQACAEGDAARSAERLAALKSFLCVNESAHQEDVDVFWFVKTLDHTIVPALSCSRDN